MIKYVPTIQIISGSGALNQRVTIGQPGDRGCVSCGTRYEANAYTSGAAHATLVVDGRGRYWCLDCAVGALMNVRRRDDERTDYVYPWTFEETGGSHGQRKGTPDGKTACQIGFDSTGVGGWCITHRKWQCSGG